MERYNRGAGAAGAPTPPSAPVNPYYTEGNPGLGVPATQPGPWWFHMITEEMRKVITDAGLTPDHTDLTQLSAAIQAMIAANSAIGPQTLYVQGLALAPNKTDGAEQIYLEMPTNKNIVAGLAFDAAVEEFAQFGVHMPKGWDRGPVKAILNWTHGATTTNFGVAYKLAAVAVSDGDALDEDYGAAVLVTDSGGTTHSLYQTAASAPITIGGVPASGDYVNFIVSRDVSDPGDTMAVAAVLIGVTIIYTTSAPTDA